MTDHPTPEQVEAAKDHVLDGHGRGLGDPYIGTLSDYIEHLEQIVAKLPVDAEGNHRLPGDTVYVIDRGGSGTVKAATVCIRCDQWQETHRTTLELRAALPIGGLGHVYFKLQDCFPTRAAAEAALEGE